MSLLFVVILICIKIRSGLEIKAHVGWIYRESQLRYTRLIRIESILCNWIYKYIINYLTETLFSVASDNKGTILGDHIFNFGLNCLHLSPSNKIKLNNT